MTKLGIVVIGRNEGDRLVCCLRSVADQGFPVVYVDSGSVDGSVERARSMGVEVVELDASQPFSAARARNTGYERLRALAPWVSFVQFLDGDSEIVAGWLDAGESCLDDHPEWGVVCGRVRERFPERSAYNRLADLEWNSPPGEIRACGGICMVRAAAFEAAGGFNPSIIAAEDDEFCLRLRRLGWKVYRDAAGMAVHDMDMTRFSQWWKRARRAGHAYAEGAALYGRSPERHFVRETRSIVFWGMLVPVLALGLAWPTRGLSLALLGGYAVLFLKMVRYFVNQRGWSSRDARLYAASCVLAKFPEALGLCRYWFGRLTGRRSPVVDFRGPVQPRPDSAKATPVPLEVH
ncbi:Glycosyl transferase family 2 [Aquisphaera giovannonii]|uniref:Glycosyl transferase family 2 n=1 Tax=Aquisphaera giovannonii TaxID=406548 RepID=A0A5B9W1W2_9BACT|nr:glycosyltransferase [Aquisphaera giovannonii]QEH34181.1 Glycosyl transferase family 2 [Aquisphaera giovannonii]